MPFFDATTAADLALLSKNAQTDGSLSSIASTAEYDVLEAFTTDFRQWTTYRLNQYMVWIGLDQYMCLRGWNADPTLCDPPLLAALKREIAALIEWRVAQKNTNPLTTSETGTSTLVGKVYRQDKNSRFPVGFGFYLRRFDVRPTPYSI